VALLYNDAASGSPHRIELSSLGLGPHKVLLWAITGRDMPMQAGNWMLIDSGMFILAGPRMLKLNSLRPIAASA